MDILFGFVCFLFVAGFSIKKSIAKILFPNFESEGFQNVKSYPLFYP